MILLDTNVLSALMNTKADKTVVNWLNLQPQPEVWTTAINIFEIRFGLSRMTAGKKRRGLEAAFNNLINDDMAGRIAIVDRAAAEAAGILAAVREAAGRPMEIRDTLIAGIALARRASIATRNTKHFTDIDVSVVDPWLI